MFTSSQLELVSDGSFRPQLFTHTFVYRSRHRSSVDRTVCKKWGAKTKYVDGNIDISTFNFDHKVNYIHLVLRHANL